MPVDLPSPIDTGDIVGLHFPSSLAEHPHPGLVVQVYDQKQRAQVIQARALAAGEGDVLCLMLMISHAPPARGTAAEFIPVAHRAGTRLDPARDIFMCYEHFDAALIPQRSLPIGSVQGAYLGRMPEQVWQHYRNQFLLVQNFKRGRSFHMPTGLWT
ncbi:MAG: hypothetical protein N4A39_15935 [Roseicyclus sp.]|nr:hypothetical protein [Roseicyclus sp.]